MKRIGVMSAALCAALVIAGCASLPPASESMASARKSAPDNVLVGMATAKESSAEASVKKAESNAKLQLARGMTSMVRNMIKTDTDAGKLTAAVAPDFQQSVLSQLTKSKLDGASKQGSGSGKGGEGWAVYYLEKADVIKEINDAVRVAKGAIKGSEGFTTDGKIDAEFRTASNRDWKN